MGNAPLRPTSRLPQERRGFRAGSAYSRSDRKELYLCGEGSFQGLGAFTAAADSGASGYIGDNTGATNRPVAGDFPRGNAGA